MNDEATSTESATEGLLTGARIVVVDDDIDIAELNINDTAPVPANGQVINIHGARPQEEKAIAAGRRTDIHRLHFDLEVGERQRAAVDIEHTLAVATVKTVDGQTAAIEIVRADSTSQTRKGKVPPDGHRTAGLRKGPFTAEGDNKVIHFHSTDINKISSLAGGDPPQDHVNIFGLDTATALRDARSATVANNDFATDTADFDRRIVS